MTDSLSLYSRCDEDLCRLLNKDSYRYEGQASYVSFFGSILRHLSKVGLRSTALVAETEVYLPPVLGNV